MKKPTREPARAEEIGDATKGSTPPAAPQDLEFLRRRLAPPILTGDDETAVRLIRELDRLLNRELAR